jgi:hypothetical protein
LVEAVKAERCKTRPWCMAVCDLLSPICIAGVTVSIFREKIVYIQKLMNAYSYI